MVSDNRDVFGDSIGATGVHEDMDDGIRHAEDFAVVIFR